MKHIGRIKNTGRRCIVVFREIYDERGNVIDEDNCLVFESDSLPDAEHQDFMRIIESEAAQATGELFNVLSRERLGTGILALNWLIETQRMRKENTSNVDLTPDSMTTLRLDKLNKIVKMQSTGSSQADIENVLRDDTDLPPRQAESISKDVADTSETADTQTGDQVLSDAEIAASFVSQAKTFEQQAKDLLEQAYAIDPSLAPKKRGRPSKKTTVVKKPANEKA